MAKKKSLSKNTAYNAIKSISSFVFPLITFPYVSRVLLTDNLGKVNFGNSVVSYFSLIASLGVATYAVRECSKCRDNKAELNKVASEIFSLNVVTTVISYFLLGISLMFWDKLSNYRILIVIQSTSILFSTIGTDWINRVMEDFRYITIRHFVFQLVSILLMFAFVRRPEDYIKYAIISLVSSSGASIINIFYRRKYCHIYFTLNIPWKKHLVPIMLLFSMQMAMVIYVNSDTTILGVYKGDMEVGLYGVSVKIYNIVQALITSVQAVLIPQLAIGFSKKDYVSLHKLLRYGFNFMLVLGLPCIVGINLVAEGAVIILASEAYLGCVLSVRILMLALLASLMAGYLGNLIMLPSGKDKISLFSSIISAMVNLVLNLILIPKFGLNAAAFTTFVSMLLGFFIKIPFVDRNLNFGFIKEDIWAPLAGCFLMCIVGFGVRCIIKPIILRTVIQIIICSAVYFLVLLIMKNDFFMDLLKSLKRKINRG